jgi:hypothetical protein
MKGTKSLVGAVGAAALMAAGSGAWADNGPGCGLGKLALDGKAGFGWNLLGWLLNGIGGNQTFGMTSGTSGCDVTKAVLNEHDRTDYAAANFDNLFGASATPETMLSALDGELRADARFASYVH